MFSHSLVSSFSVLFAVTSLFSQLSLAAPRVSRESVKNYPLIVKLFAEMSDAAITAGYIAAFSYTERFATSSVGNCEVRSAEAALVEVKEVAKEILIGGQVRNRRPEYRFSQGNGVFGRVHWRLSIPRLRNN